MVSLTSTYEGGLRCRATHGPSGTTLITDAPVDNHGKGESFSPTDLVATALGADPTVTTSPTTKPPALQQNPTQTWSTRSTSTPQQKPTTRPVQ